MIRNKIYFKKDVIFCSSCYKINLKLKINFGKQNLSQHFPFFNFVKTHFIANPLKFSEMSPIWCMVMMMN